MPVTVRFHDRVLQYERGQVVQGLSRGPVLDGLIRSGRAEVLAETPDRPIDPPAPDATDDAPTTDDGPAAEPEPAPERKPRRPRKTDDDAAQ